MLHLEALTQESKELFPVLSNFNGDFYLAGGTALALQIGHRISVDFDLFTDNPIKRTLLERVEKLYAPRPIEPLVNDSRELTVRIDGVKHTFLHYPFPPILVLAKNDPIDLLSPKEILAAKAYAIGRRGSFKDYVDLYIGLRERLATFQEVIDLSDKKYSDAFNSRLFLEQLLYLDDVTEKEVIMLNRSAPASEEITDFFAKEIYALRITEP